MLLAKLLVRVCICCLVGKPNFFSIRLAWQFSVWVPFTSSLFRCLNRGVIFSVFAVCWLRKLLQNPPRTQDHGWTDYMKGRDFPVPPLLVPSSNHCQNTLKSRGKLFSLIRKILKYPDVEILTGVRISVLFHISPLPNLTVITTIISNA
jgi:hypothetical protein